MRIVKVVVIGDGHTGKTSIIQQYMNKNSNLGLYKATIGVDFFTKDILLSHTKLTLQVWDTAGQERFSSLSNAYYRGCGCCILVFDLTKPDSLKHLLGWMNKFLSFTRDVRAVNFIVIGNKSDLVSLRRITQKDIDSTMKSLQRLLRSAENSVIENSPKSSINSTPKNNQLTFDSLTLRRKHSYTNSSQSCNSPALKQYTPKSLQPRTSIHSFYSAASEFSDVSSMNELSLPSASIDKDIELLERETYVPNDNLRYFETSAFDHESVKLAFEYAALYHSLIRDEVQFGDDDIGPVSIEPTNNYSATCLC